jgi:hypothetical protein
MKPTTATAKAKKYPLKKVSRPIQVQSPMMIDMTNLNMSIENIYASANEKYINHMYGYSSTNKTKKMCDYIWNANQAGVIFVCFKSKAEVWAIYSGNENNIFVGMIAGQDNDYDLAVNKIIFCTTAKCRNLLIDMKQHDDIGRITWILIDSWDKYDANAYAVYGLSQYYKMNVQIMFISVSPYCHLPIASDAPYGVQHPQIIEEYIEVAPLKLATEVKVTTVLYGPYMESPNSRVHIADYPEHAPNARVVIDSLLDYQGKPITKHQSYLRANSIDEGLIYRCKSLSNFEKLSNNYPLTRMHGFDSVAIYLLAHGIELEPIFPANHQKAIKNILALAEEKQLEKVHLKFIAYTGLELQPSIFLHDWMSQVASTPRNNYVGCLVACLINLAPTTYGPRESFTQYVGRNDIETMCNMWANLMNVSNTAVYKLEGRVKGFVANWCRSNNFYTNAILDLCQKVDHLLDKFPVREPAVVTKKGERPRRPRKPYFKRISTIEFNVITVLLAGIYPKDVVQKWDLNELLPHYSWNEPGINTVVLHHRGNVLLMYINEEDLYDFVRQPEDISEFDELWSI